MSTTFPPDSPGKARVRGPGLLAACLATVLWLSGCASTAPQVQSEVAPATAAVPAP